MAGGSEEGRKRGGVVSQQKRKDNPEFYRNLGCIVRNQFLKPTRSTELAELLGIILGDGELTKYQLKITLNSEADKEYVEFVQRLILRLFERKPSLYKHLRGKAIALCISGIELTEFLIKQGLKIGNKVKNQIDVPMWVKEDKDFSKYCLRGLVDTDGCIFLRKDSKGRLKYQYLNLYFSNLSQPLRIFAFRTLTEFGFNPKYFGNNHVRLYSQKETLRYLDVIGSSNERISKWLRYN